MKRSQLAWSVSVVLVASACGGDGGRATYTYVAGLGASTARVDTTGAGAAGSPTDRDVVGSTTPDTVPVVVQVTLPPVTVSADDANAADDANDAAIDATDRSVDETVEVGLNPLGGDSPEDRLMPDVTCMNLQAAQDEIQDHGVFFSRSEDATGEGRRQIWDRNWQVIDQTPEPGEPIDEGEAVLFVVKDDDDHPNPC